MGALLTGDVLVRYFLAFLNTLIYIVVGVWLFHLPVDFQNLTDVFVVLLLAMAALTGRGLAGGSTFTLLNAKRWGTNPVEWIVGFGVTLLAGVYFPPDILPAWLQRTGEWLPQTPALHAARLCLSGKATLTDPSVVPDIIFLLQFTLVALPIGILLLAAGLRKAQRNGTLTRWS